MPETEPRKPEEVLAEILSALGSKEPETRLQAIRRLHEIKYSSEAIRNALERLSLRDPNEDVRAEALYALDLATHKNVRARFNKIERGVRGSLLRELEEWEQAGLLEKENAAVIRRRYDFDFAPAAAPKIQTQPVGEPARQEILPEAKPVPAPQASAPQVSSPTLTQTLLSETSVKIALYLGAFFVISAAAIFAALVEMIRLPILILGALLFGGLAVAIKKRLPQPSFTLFVVFSFLLPIAANVLQESLDLSPPFIAAYWVFVSAFMALIWAGGTRLYESRLFSVVAFVSLTVAFFRVGDMFDAAEEFYPVMLGVAALTGLLGAWLLKRWRDSKLALPLFISAQILQAAVIAASMTVYLVNLGDGGSSLWNLAHIFVWGFAFAFYVLSDNLYPFILFPWFAAGALIGFPFFLGAAFEMNELGGAITFSIWGFFLAAASEAAHWLERMRKYSLPVLLVAVFTSAYGIGVAFANNNATGFLVALWFAFAFSVVHFIRPRGLLWALALFDFIVAYFTFFALPFMEGAEIFFGYKLLGLSVLFLLPDLFSSNDFSLKPHWRAAPRVYGAIFTFASLATYVVSGAEALRGAVMFGAYAFFFALYAFAQRKAVYGYLPATYLALTVVYSLNHFDVDAWLPALTVLAALYFIVGAFLRPHKSWSRMLRNSGLILGGLVAFSALVLLKPQGGWYALFIGLLFAAEMYLAKNGWFEIGAPVLFNVGAFLVLRDFDVERVEYHLLVYSALWLLGDLVARVVFPNPRPLKWVLRGVGALLALANYFILFFNSEPRIAAAGFAAYLILFSLVALVYRNPALLYTLTGTFPLLVIFLLREFEFTRWIHPLIVIAAGYYGLGFILRWLKFLPGWDSALLASGLAAGGVASLGSLAFDGLDPAIPPAIAATLFAVEAFARKNVWLGFPANGLYLLSYFIILLQLDVDQPQFYSVGAAALGMIQHYFLTRAGSKAGAFIMGMVSQLTLLGTTYVQMASLENLLYFFALFLQAMAVIAYGVIIRSRSLTFTPIGIIVLGLFTVLYSALKGLGAVVLVGCSGVILLMLGILAVILRERISNLGEKLSDWKA